MGPGGGLVADIQGHHICTLGDRQLDKHSHGFRSCMKLKSANIPASCLRPFMEVNSRLLFTKSV